MDAGVIIETMSGRLRGARSGDGGCAFKGIPFGAPTSGANRFRAPRPVAPWPGVRDALSFGGYCPQVDQKLPAGDPHALGGVPALPNEDCLNLNVWTPACDGARRPVLVWLHPGGFTMGTTAHPVIDGARLAQYGDAVVVSIGHRLGVFGYLFPDEADAEMADSANAGLLDIVLGLQWVRDNISAFGGDPGNVTLFGESGGGRKISALMAMPLASGLYHKAIVQSGAHPKAFPRAGATAFADGLMRFVGAATIDDMQHIPADDLCVAVSSYCKGRPDLGGGIVPARALWALSPVRDGLVLERDPWVGTAPDASPDVPLLIGTTADETALYLAREPESFALTPQQVAARCRAVLGAGADEILAAHRRCDPNATAWEQLVAISGEDRRMMSIGMAELKAAAGRASAFMYVFGWRSDVGQYRAAHTLDVPFLFRTMDASPISGSRLDRFAMSDQICDAWLAFARNGTPACEAVGDWPPYDPGSRATMVLDIPPRLGRDPLSDLRRAWPSELRSMPWEENAFVGGFRPGI